MRSGSDELVAFAALLAIHRIAVDPDQLQHDIGRRDGVAAEDLLRPAKVVGLTNWRDQFAGWLLTIPGDPAVGAVPTFDDLLDPLPQMYGSRRRRIRRRAYTGAGDRGRELPT